MSTLLIIIIIRLDKFWMHHDVRFDFAVDFTETGDRPVMEAIVRLNRNL